MNKIPNTVENWEDGTLGQDERYAKVSDLELPIPKRLSLYQGGFYTKEGYPRVYIEDYMENEYINGYLVREGYVRYRTDDGELHVCEVKLFREIYS